MGLGATPLDNLIPPAAGMDLHQGLATSGVVWRLGASAQSVERTASGYRVTLDQGSPVEADLVLSAIGLRPALGLARAAGIEVNRGIVTDALLATSAPDIFALGDCAEVEGQVRLFVLPLMQGARALAQTLAGAPTPVRYPVMPVVIKTPARPVVIASGRGDWHCAAVAAGVRCEQRKDGQMTGFCLTGAAVAEKQALTATLSQQSAAAA
jgi:rubredoxin-NAD+ reductase